MIIFSNKSISWDQFQYYQDQGLNFRYNNKPHIICFENQKLIIIVSDPRQDKPTIEYSGAINHDNIGKKIDDIINKAYEDI